MSSTLNQDWYSLDDVAAHYGVSRRTVERWAQRGLLTITLVAGTTRRVSRHALLAFEEENRAVPSSILLHPTSGSAQATSES